MKEQFCTYEISLKLKELGFDEECMGAYMIRSSGDKYFSQIPSMKPNYSKWDIYVPLWQQVIDWFREKYKLWIYFIPDGEFDSNSTYYRIDSKDKDIILDKLNNVYSYISLKFKTPNEAREQAILKAIELIKQ